MTNPFAFVPRAVSKYAKEWHGITRPPSPPPDATTDEDDDDHGDEPKGKEKAIEPTPHPKQYTVPQDIASLVSLALSDYNIWLDSDLRWKLDACLQDVSPDDAGFVPINYLLRRAPFRGRLSLPNDHPEPSETDVVKALRAHASRTLEVRMRLPLASASSASSSTAPASSVWYGSGKTSRKKDVGAYEVRRRDWVTLRDRPSHRWTRARWDALTAYMECIPPQHRSVGGIARFAESLLLQTVIDTDPDADPRSRVQSIALMPHYLDQPGDVPKCKGYALVTFSTKSDVEIVLRAWPWRRRAPNSENDTSPVVREALKYGLRAISKARWDALNEEYLAYKQVLVDEVTRADHGEPVVLPHPYAETQSYAETQAQAQSEMEVQTTSSSPYPFDCLVFVRNVHPDTNKTMLKSIFSRAFQDRDRDQGDDRTGPGQGRPLVGGLDYVDFTKGMDTCYVRLASPSYTARLIAYFDANPTTQAHGLDETGRVPLVDDKPIAMEKVRGKKEELYWEKIPNKVRRQAVERVVQARLEGGADAESESATGCDGADGSRRKKRTRED